MKAILWVFLGGGLGSIFRYLISLWFKNSSSGFPVKTFIANIISCFILGLLMGYFLKSSLQHQYKLFLMTGFCGGFSTFSTFSAEVFTLIENQQISVAILYISASVLLGTLILFGGYLLGQTL